MLLAVDPSGIGLAVLAFAVLMLPLVVIHELGHFVAAKIFGIKVLEFGIGFPPRVRGLAWRRGETEYTINWLPIGGFVRLLGEEDPSDPRSLAAAPRWQRLIVMFAGVAMNVVLAVLLLTVGFMIPRERELTLAQVTDVAPGSPASEARILGTMRDGSPPRQGIQPGDIILEIEGREVKNTAEVLFANRLNLGETQDWVISRANSTLQAKVYARWDPPPGQGPTGIRVGAPTKCAGVDDDGNPTNCTFLYPFTESVWYWPWEALPKGVQALWDTIILTRNELRIQLSGGNDGASLSGDQPAVSGPVGIASQTGDLVQEQGWRPLIEIAALLSLSLAVFNALPVPGLDGGRMLFVVIEMLRGGRRISPEKEGLIHLMGIALLMFGALIVTYFDIARLV